ncbi:MAG TPA: hypothetical protein VKA59_22655 [Vicinamibacterales bacterium]|nr:hypothetical protein [Vicinamibacterales bacterium]
MLARPGIGVGIAALMVTAVIVITGGFVVDAGPLFLSVHRLLPPFVVAAAAYLLAFLQGPVAPLRSSDRLWPRHVRGDVLHPERLS